jgi:hypothetical protein
VRRPGTVAADLARVARWRRRVVPLLRRVVIALAYAVGGVVGALFMACVVAWMVATAVAFWCSEAAAAACPMPAWPTTAEGRSRIGQIPVLGPVSASSADHMSNAVEVDGPTSNAVECSVSGSGDGDGHAATRHQGGGSTITRTR